jgi:anhydro-N-acetylmuramic acid kinase
MSGTSADGVDVALCRIAPATQPGGTPRLKLLAHRGFPYSPEVRAAVLAAANAPETSTANLARLSWRLGEVYADALTETIARTGIEPQLIALHGQTLFHETTPTDFLGAPTRSTWQAGEPAVLAERLRLPVVSDFRTADLAAGGQGAPLVPMLDYTLFRHKTRNRILLNLGGIANLTVLPANAGPEAVLAFDTGPANMVIDACMERLTGRVYDCGGGVAGRGTTLQKPLKTLLQDPFFAQNPPKSCGREQFGAAFVDHFLSLCSAENAQKRDIIATATALTAESILDAYRRFVWPHLGQKAPLAKATDLLVSGGGARNVTIMKHLRAAFEPLYVNVKTTEDAGLPIEAKEAAAFALLAWLTWHHLPGNIPAATGATRPVILGRITHV